MKGTYELPTEPGVYLYQEHPGGQTKEVRILDGGKNWGLYVDDRHSSSLLSMRGMYWLGKKSTLESIRKKIADKKEDLKKELGSLMSTGKLNKEEIEKIIDKHLGSEHFL